jgi:hypothetical protein
MADSDTESRLPSASKWFALGYRGLDFPQIVIKVITVV